MYWFSLLGKRIQSETGKSSDLGFRTRVDVLLNMRNVPDVFEKFKQMRRREDNIIAVSLNHRPEEGVVHQVSPRKLQFKELIKHNF